MPDATISVVIPIRHGGALLGDVLTACLAQTPPPSEILLLDSGDDDRDVPHLPADPRIHRIRIAPQHFSHGATRMDGVRRASGEYVILLTQDATPGDPQCFAQLITPLADAQIAATYARHRPRADAGVFERFLRERHYPMHDDAVHAGARQHWLSHTAAAYRRATLIACNGFRTDVPVNEDMAFAQVLDRRGFRVRYVPEAWVWHSHHYTVAAAFARYFDVGAFAVRCPRVLQRTNHEGASLVRELIAHCMRERRIWSLPTCLLACAWRWLAFRVGCHAWSLPAGLAARLGANRAFWQRRVRHA